MPATVISKAHAQLQQPRLFADNRGMTQSTSTPRVAAQRIVVMMPNWLGDGVMATPFLRALRGIYPQAHIAAMGRPIIAPVLTGLPYINEAKVLSRAEEKQAVAWLKREKFDLGILLPNSLRSAATLWRGGVKHRLGYAREWRSPLLTHRINPIRRSAERHERDAAMNRAITEIRAQMSPPPENPAARAGGKYEPIPTIDYYLALATYLSDQADTSRRMHLGITAAEQADAHAALASLGIATDGSEPLVILVPGANFGSSKCWPPERFAQIADRLMDRRNEAPATVLIASSPAELPIVDAILAASMLCPNGGGLGKLHALAKLNNGKGVSLGALKEIVRLSSLMICNDTGPRHFAVALGRPVVTLFGPTDPVWAETFFDLERQVRIDVPCGPCQLKRCPVDHRCMRGIEVEHVLTAVTELRERQLVARER